MKAPAAIEIAISSATNATRDRPGTRTSTDQSAISAASPPTYTGFLRPMRSDIGPYAMLATDQHTSIAEVSTAAPRVLKPYCDTRNGTPQRPAKVRITPE